MTNVIIFVGVFFALWAFFAGVFILVGYVIFNAVDKMIKEFFRGF